MIAAALVPVACGVAASIGMRIGAALCHGVVGFADGPDPVRVPAWAYVAAGVGCGFPIAAHGWPVASVGFACIVIAALAVCCACDLQRGFLPDWCTLGLCAMALGLAVVRHDATALIGTLAIGLPFAALAMSTAGRGMGWGDVKLAAAGGALLGFGASIGAFLVAAVAAYAIARRMRRANRPIPFGAYLATAIAVTFSLVAPG